MVTGVIQVSGARFLKNMCCNVGGAETIQFPCCNSVILYNVNLYKYEGRVYIQLQLSESHKTWSQKCYILIGAKTFTLCASPKKVPTGEAAASHDHLLLQSMLLTATDPCPRRRHSFKYLYFPPSSFSYIVHILISINVYLD